ncbi:MAG TPA: UGSC family (seleno)protein [Acidobacteriota bacterium]|nr:UGSC family (seleno)protein [Acidobacteriota bacterium]
MGKPAAGVVTNRFVDIARGNAKKKGMPNARLVFVPHPVQGMTSAQHKAYIAGKDPVTGKQVMQEIIDALTGPLTDDDRKTGFVDTKAPARLIGPQTPDNLQRLFQASGWTDYLPVILPTEKKVSDMMKGTSRRPDEVVGKMTGGDYEPWEYTVEQVAVNAVMAGAKPEHLPLILAIASTGISSFYNSPDSLVRAVVVNGPVREEIGMNFETGAMGPFNAANAAIGRAWTLLSKNLGNAGILGETYTGSQGNSLNYDNIVIAENEKSSPWAPLSVQKGFKAGDSVVSIFTGLGMHPGQGAKRGGETLKPAYNAQISSILDTFSGFFGALVVCDPLVAKNLKAAGFDTKEKLSEWLQSNTKLAVADYKESNYVALYDAPRAKKGEQPYAAWFKLPPTARIPRFASPKDIEIVVVGGETLAVFQAGNLKYMTSAVVDKWR